MNDAVAAARRRRTWLDHALRTNAQIIRQHGQHPMVDAVVEEIDGRRIRIGDHWLTDFASCNYLGLDLDEEVIEGVAPYLRRWGTHPSWARLIASPALFEQIEAELVELLGAEAVLCLPMLTLIHQNTIPVLSAGGAIWLDDRAHRTIADGCAVARGLGTEVHHFRHNDPDDLATKLAADAARAPAGAGPRLVCMDGIQSMTGNPADLAAFAAVAAEHGALLYVDDAHGFGVIGERAPDEPSPYGRRGNALVRHLGLGYDNLVLTAGFSKAYSSLLAFVACSDETKHLLKLTAPGYVYSGPPPVASLATSQIGLRVNAERGDAIRSTLHRRTRLVIEHLDKLEAAIDNHSDFPIVNVVLANPADVWDAGRLLYERGIYVTLTPHPIVPRQEVGFRIQVTAANTDEEIDHLADVLTEVRDRFGLRTIHA
jgi:8-amino-7-oxononanoate synthase